MVAYKITKQQIDQILEAMRRRHTLKVRSILNIIQLEELKEEKPKGK